MRIFTLRWVDALPGWAAPGVLLWCCAVGPVAFAQALRDPTVPPASALSAPAANASGRAPAPDIGPVAVIVREGRPYLVVGTRLYAAGQSIGALRVERITETEVWLREGKTLHKKPIFAGIVRSSAVAGRCPRNVWCRRPHVHRPPRGETCTGGPQECRCCPSWRALPAVNDDDEHQSMNQNLPQMSSPVSPSVQSPAGRHGPLALACLSALVLAGCAVDRPFRTPAVANTVRAQIA